MADIICTITKIGRCDKYGRPLTVGMSYTASFEEVRGLYLAGFASVADNSVFDDDAAPGGSYFAPIPAGTLPVASTINKVTGGIEKVQAGAVDLRTVMAKRRSPITAVMPTVPTLVFGSAITGTASLLTTAPGDFDAVALIFCNINSANMVIDGAAVAVSERSDSAAAKYIPIINGTQYNALAGATNQLGFVPVTWSGDSSVTIAAGTSRRPTWSLSDFVPLSSIPRVDGGMFPIVLAREYSNARIRSVNYLTNAAAMVSLNEMIAPYEWYNMSQSATNAVSTPGGMTAPTDSGVCRIHGVAFRLRGTGDLVVFTGDSITKGLGAGGYDADIGSVSPVGSVTPEQVGKSWPAQSMVALSNKDRPAGYINAGVNGSSTAEFYTRLADLTALLKPTVVVAPAYTPNELMNTAVASASLAKAISFVDTYQQMGAVPVIVAPTPYGGAGSESVRQSIIARIAGMRGVTYIDTNVSGVYDATNSANNFWASGATVDNTHGSLAGYTAIASGAAVPVLKLLLG